MRKRNKNWVQNQNHMGWGNLFESREHKGWTAQVALDNTLVAGAVAARAGQKLLVQGLLEEEAAGWLEEEAAV
ncbi:hypothetical protein Acr_08g0010570 [Actinidia rufa]|uniref:Uncharacterized protein n=1 Tax=Actinidia rufa TaxID=165716 RepID=A0A7J0F1U2_9ERIC|nr:hypothetical protein Acr_08g0010570 [Actinidia rufa]